jgi:5,10-methylenetetrahydromethanopterin reductase
MRFGFGVNPQGIGDAIAAGAQAEKLGFDRIGIWDSPVAHREAWVTLGAVAAATKSLRLGPWVTNGITRHPVVTAAAAATLDDIAPGRVILGVGTGDSGVYNLGAGGAKLADLEEFVAAVRGLLNRGRATWRGQPLALDWPGDRDIKIFVSAHGPRALRLAGRIGDGVIVGSGVSPKAIAGARELIATGCAEAGKDESSVETWWMAPWYISELAEQAKNDALWHLTSLVHHWSRTGGSGMFPDELRDGIIRLGSGYHLRSHGDPSPEEKARYAADAERFGVADYLRRRFTFSGTPTEVGEQMAAANEAGARNLDCANASPPGRVMDRPFNFHRLVRPLIDKRMADDKPTVAGPIRVP